MNPAFWKDKKVFLTGHTGFKGSWLTLWLHAMGAKVTGYALAPPTDPSLFEVAAVHDKLEASYEADIRDLKQLTECIAKHQPEIIIHMAAQPLVRYSYTNPVETYEVNVMGSVNLLEAVRRSNTVKAVVNVTTDKCYENKEWNWGYRENEPMGGYDPYSNSKGCAELVTSSYRNSFFNVADYSTHGVAIASARAGNVIGGGDWADDRLLPDFIRAMIQKEPVVIRSPKAIRPWQHVLEPLGGYLTLAENLYNLGPQFAEGWNFGPNDEDARNVEWIVDTMTTLWGDGASWKLDQNPQPHEANYLKLDISKAKMQLNWQPRWSLGTALQNIVFWYHAWHKNEDMQKITLEQIQAYMNSK